MPDTTNKGQFKIYADDNGTKGSLVGTYIAKSLKIGYESISSEDSGRADDGTMHINWIKQKVRKLEIEMPPYTESDKTTLSGLISAVQGKSYWIEYWDVIAANPIAIRVYTSSVASECYSGVIANGMWIGVTFNAIDMSGENYA